MLSLSSRFAEWYLRFSDEQYAIALPERTALHGFDYFLCKRFEIALIFLDLAFRIHICTA